MEDAHVIVNIPAEGGCIRLLGRLDAANEWHFSRRVQDQSRAVLVGAASGEEMLEDESDWVDSWADAVALLDHYPWATLGGRHVHPEFRERVWSEVSRKLQTVSEPYATRARDRWSMACEPNSVDT